MEAERFITGAALLINTSCTFVDLGCRNTVVLNVEYSVAHSKVMASVMHCDNRINGLFEDFPCVNSAPLVPTQL